ncbi:glutamate--tRNA ligase [Candidatus Parcubacteria bacterium]|nr:glutamate--tRNA ligase [Candidatus Parcubacteria bacterium]
MSIKTRFAPSPTGFLHSGNYRTAVFAYLYAKANKGTFALRIEDTDRERSKKEYEENIMESLAWLELPHDEFVRQSERITRHTGLLEKLVREGKAYVSREESKNEPGKTVELIRLKNPGKAVTFHDEIRGDITMDTSDLNDFAIGRAIDDPLFHFAVVVDDADMDITHVIRGEDHISNTPRQILILEALGFSIPKYAHLPMVLASDRTKLSKRKGAKPLTDYRAMGILPEAMLNYLAFLGFHPKDDKEYLTRDELVAVFSFDRVHTSGAMFDETKLFSVNQHWMRKLTDEEFITRGELDAPDKEKLLKTIPLLKERAQTFGEAREMLSGELSCLFSTPTVNKGKLLAKEPEDAPGFTKNALEGILELLAGLPNDVSAEQVKETVMPYADGVGATPGEAGSPDAPLLGAFRGAVLWPLRYALSGAERSPDPFTLISIVGKNESSSRIKTALAIL